MESSNMKKVFSAIAAVVAVSTLPQVVQAEDSNPLSFNIGAITEYRYRGISQTRLKPAVQGGADYAFASGFYVGTWLSNIKWIKDAGQINAVDVGSANIEWDIYGGYKGEIAKDFTYDVGVLQYYYPSNKNGNIPNAANANTTEIYGALTFGPATVKYSHAVTTLFGFGDSKNSGYLEAAATFDLGNGFGITPHVGYQRVTGNVAGVSNSVYSYTDYALTGTKDFGSGFVVSLAAVGTKTKDVPAPAPYAYFSPDGKNLGKFTAVLGVKYTF
jgi:uncharacterized protein (TIGR02001 family)